MRAVVEYIYIYCPDKNLIFLLLPPILLMPNGVAFFFFKTTHGASLSWNLRNSGVLGLVGKPRIARKVGILSLLYHAQNQNRNLHNPISATLLRL